MMQKKKDKNMFNNSHLSAFQELVFLEHFSNEKLFTAIDLKELIKNKN